MKSSKIYRRLFMLVLIVLMLIRPTLSTEKNEREMSNLNIWFVVDATGSMVAKDSDNGTRRRFELVQDDVAKIVTGVPGAKYSVIVQDFSSYSAVPLTSNSDAILAASPYLQPKFSFYSKPSNFTELFAYTEKRVSSYKSRYPERNNVLVFMSDGEDVVNDSIGVPDALANLVDQSLILGYGSSDGSILEQVGNVSTLGGSRYLEISDEYYVTYFGDNPKVTVDSKHRVISKIDEKNLQDISDTLHGKYYHRESGALPDELISGIEAIPTYTPSDSVANTRAETYWIFAVLLLVLLGWEGEELLTNILRERSKNA